MNRNSRLFNTRYQQIVVVCIFLMFILCVKLFMVTVLQHDRWTAEASEQNTKAVYTSAPRGNIYERNGQLIYSLLINTTVNGQLEYFTTLKNYNIADGTQVECSLRTFTTASGASYPSIISVTIS